MKKDKKKREDDSEKEDDNQKSQNDDDQETENNDHKQNDQGGSYKTDQGGSYKTTVYFQESSDDEEVPQQSTSTDADFDKLFESETDPLNKEVSNEKVNDDSNKDVCYARLLEWVNIIEVDTYFTLVFW